jgi:hypothetical protein
MSGDYSNADYLEIVEIHRNKLKRERLQKLDSTHEKDLIELTKRAYDKAPKTKKIAYAEQMRNHDLRRWE